MLVVVGELGFDDVVPASQQAFGRFLHRGEELVLGPARPVAAHHVVRFIDCRRSRSGS